MNTHKHSQVNVSDFLKKEPLNTGAPFVVSTEALPSKEEFDKLNERLGGDRRLYLDYLALHKALSESNKTLVTIDSIST